MLFNAYFILSKMQFKVLKRRIGTQCADAAFNLIMLYFALEKAFIIIEFRTAKIKAFPPVL